MSDKAYDACDRIVFFKEKCCDFEIGCYFAMDAQTSVFSFYKVRHRECGPAMINRRGERRWFIDGNEVTKKVESFLMKNSDVFKLGDDTFTLNKRICDKMKLIGVFNIN